MTQSQPWIVVPVRDLSVDLLRSVAITIMVAANLIPFLLDPPPPFWLRLVASVAAPLFIFLAGMMVALSVTQKKHLFFYFVLRGSIVILLGALLDVVARGNLPFIDFDVLYLIGISLPLTYLFLRLGMPERGFVLLSIVAATPLIQGIFGYSGLPLQIPLAPVFAGAVMPAVPEILCQWLVEGWFPLFPWLAVALLGAQAGTFRWQENTIRSFAGRNFILMAGIMLMAGAIAWYLMPGPMLMPHGYAELFYPPTGGFLLFITGLILWLFVAADIMTASGFAPACLQLPGQCPLAVYAVHTIVIEQCIRPLHLQVSLYGYLAGYLVFLTALVGMAFAIRYLRLRLAHPSFIVRILIGG